jgi:S-adenosylmethionine synthetase
MATQRRIVSSEAPTIGHPDKLADQIADGVVDQVLVQDPTGRCGCEVLVNSDVIVVAGEFKTRAELDVERVVESVIHATGYDRGDFGFSRGGSRLVTTIRNQSSEISAVIEKSKSGMGASDQGIVYGYATDETEELLPTPIVLAHGLVRRMDSLRLDGTLDWLRPDGKALVCVEYEGVDPVRVSQLVLAAQHDPEISYDEICRLLEEQVIAAVVPERLYRDTEVVINKLGRFVLGGPAIDTGITGRKIVCDTYGGVGKVGGGAFCGKDPTKLDRSGAYYGRQIARSVVASGLARRCEVEISFAFGTVDALSTTVNTFDTSDHSAEDILSAIQKHFDFRIASIVE